jgi:gluconate 2-dehydrogenase subunit 3-like protein
MDRRETIKVLAAGLGFWLTPAEVRHAAEFVAKARSAGTPYEPKFFTPHEWETVRVLVDLVIPRDARSGSATDALVPEFMDFVMTDQPGRQTPMRGGLAWLDTESRQRFGRSFVECADAQRTAVLDDIAWPDKAKPEHSQGVAFFNAFRDLTASGFWSSKMGVQDLQYLGNAVVLEWKGCPDEQLNRLGVQYAGTGR